MQEAAPSIPKPMVPIANRPILLHIMKYYAHFGHDDFVICLGHKGDVIKEYFLNYNEALANDFVLSQGGAHVELLASDIRDWRITFVNTGLQSNVGQRLKAVQDHLRGEEIFLATYGDAVTDAPLLADARQLSRARQDGRLPLRAPEELLVPHRPALGWRDRPRTRRRDAGRHVDQRRLLHLPARDLRPHPRGRGVGRGAVPAADRRRGADRLSVRRILGADGHPEGQAQPRNARGVGSASVGGLDGSRQRPDHRKRPGRDHARAEPDPVTPPHPRDRLPRGRHRDRLRRDDPSADRDTIRASRSAGSS